MDTWWKSFADKVIPILAALAAGEKRSELAALLAGAIAGAKRSQSLGRILWNSWFLWITVGIRSKLLFWSIPSIALTIVLLGVAQYWCGGRYPVAWWMYLWPLAAALVFARGVHRCRRDSVVQPVPSDLMDGRIGTPEVFARYTPVQQDLEFERANRRKPSVVTGELGTVQGDLRTARGTGTADEIKQLEELERQLSDELDASHAFQRALERRPATQPLMDDAEFAAELDKYGSLNRSPFAHMLGMAHEHLLIAFLILGAALSLGSYALQSGGVNLVYAVLIGLCGFVSFLIGTVGFWLGVVLPAQGLETVSTAPAKPITAIYQLVMQILPDIDKNNVEARFGKYTGEAFTKIRDDLKSLGRVSLSKLAVVYMTGLVFPHWFLALAVVLIAIVTGAGRTNKEVEGLDTKAERQADAIRLQKVLTFGLAAQLLLLFVLLYGRGLVVGIVMWVLARINNALQPVLLSRPGHHLQGGAYVWAWIGYIFGIVVLFIIASALWKQGETWRKAKTWIEPKLGIAALIGAAFLFSNAFFSIFTVPYVTGGGMVEAIRSTLLCPVPAASSAVIATTLPPAMPPMAAPAPFVSQPAPVVASAETAPEPSPSRPRPRRRTRRSPETRIVSGAAQSLGCPDADQLPRCDERVYGQGVAALREACLCR